MARTDSPGQPAPGNTGAGSSPSAAAIRARQALAYLPPATTCRPARGPRGLARPGCASTPRTTSITRSSPALPSAGHVTPAAAPAGQPGEAPRLRNPV